MEDKQTRTIIDMIRDDANNSESKKNWKTFRDKLRLKRAGRAWTSSVPIPASDIQMPPKPNRMMIRRGSARYSSSKDNEDEEEEEEEQDRGNKEVHESDGEANRHLGDLPDRQRSNRLLPVETDPDPDPNDQDPDQETTRGDEPISLMALLSTDGSNYEQQDDDEDEEEEEEHDHEDEIGDYNVCNECRGKHTKGAPVGPCGHMFCKHCTKEMQIGKGNCPACNNFILEILDIF